jgi:hypothetical protein
VGGAGYNPSLSAGRAARSKATTRTPVHFWLDVPLYRIHLPCLDEAGESLGHVFLSRTPLPEDLPDAVTAQPLYCGLCRLDRWVIPAGTAVEWPKPTDEQTNLEQDRGIMKERAAIWLARNAARAWDAEGEASLMEEATDLFGLTMTEVRRLFAGIVQSDAGPSASLAKCRAGLHWLTPGNIDIVGKYRTCKACRRAKQQARREKAKSDEE